MSEVDAPTKKPVKIPKTTGACADRLYAIKEEIGALEAEQNKLKEERRAIEDYLVNELPKDDARGVSGRVAKVSISSKPIATVKDWDAFYKHILKTKDFSLMQRRVADPAVREHWDAGKKVPGVDAFNVVKVSVTKIG